MEVTLVRDFTLPAGCVRLPESISGGGEVTLRFGCATISARPMKRAADAQVQLAPDLWEQLAIPFEEMRLQFKSTGPRAFELGPTIGILYAGNPGSRRGAAETLDLYYDDLDEKPGLYAIMYESTIDWAQGTIEGYLFDNSSRARKRVSRSRIPIPAVVRLAWAIRHDVIKQLRELTRDRTFNWVRSIGKWEFHQLMSEVRGVRKHLPNTQLYRSAADLIAMLVRHKTVFVKHAHTIQGLQVARVQLDGEGVEIGHIERQRQKVVRFSHPLSCIPYLKQALGQGRWIVQQGVSTQGRQNRALDFRVVVAQDANGWWAPLTTARVAPDDELVITNVANGATDEVAVDSLKIHYGMTEQEALACIDRMTTLCIKAAGVLGQHYHPLGIIGFDLALDRESDQIWMIEANSVPGLDYEPNVGPTEHLYRSQIEYALSLAGFD